MSQPRTQQAYARIIDMILSGALAPGDALQEAKLGVALDMSRTPVREAIKRIEAEGLAVQDGRFLKVRQLTPAEVEEIFVLRRILETHAARCAVRMVPALRRSLEERVLILRRDGPGEDDEQRRVDDDLHRAVAETTGNAMMVRTVDDLRRRTCMFDHTLLPGRFEASCREHLDILAALGAGDGERAGRLMDAHVAAAGTAILERLAASAKAAER